MNPVSRRRQRSIESSQHSLDFWFVVDAPLPANAFVAVLPSPVVRMLDLIFDGVRRCAY